MCGGFTREPLFTREEITTRGGDRRDLASPGSPSASNSSIWPEKAIVISAIAIFQHREMFSFGYPALRSCILFGVKIAQHGRFLDRHVASSRRAAIRSGTGME